MVADIPKMFAQPPRRCGRARTNATLMMIVAKPCRRQINATETAVRHVYRYLFVWLGRSGNRGKKMRNRTKLWQNLSPISGGGFGCHTSPRTRTTVSLLVRCPIAQQHIRRSSQSYSKLHLRAKRGGPVCSRRRKFRKSCRGG